MDAGTSQHVNLRRNCSKAGILTRRRREWAELGILQTPLTLEVGVCERACNTVLRTVTCYPILGSVDSQGLFLTVESALASGNSNQLSTCNRLAG
jgi:hypothetical protein